MSFGGDKFNDSPKSIYKSMINDVRFKDYHLIWAFSHPENFQEIQYSVKVNSLAFFIAALRSRIWITNSSVERGLNFKPKDTFCFNTWHGTPLKKMGNEKNNENGVKLLNNLRSADAVTVQSDFDKKIFVSAMGAKNDSILRYGLPRNDILFKKNDDRKEKVLKRFGIDKNKKIILYAPTFREYNRDKQNQIIDYSSHFMSVLQDKSRGKYTILYRAHYAVDKESGPTGDGIIDVSKYENLNDLIEVSDVLITDYSSIMFDYSITEKPIIIFQYDHDDYVTKRGLYFDVESKLLAYRDITALQKGLENNLDIAKAKVREFKREFIKYGENATQNSVDFIYTVTEETKS